MRLPRDVSGEDLARALAVFGYVKTRQTGSHVRLTTTEPGEHHLTVPSHAALRLGTLAGIVQDVAMHFQIMRDEAVRRVEIFKNKACPTCKASNQTILSPVGR